MHRSGTLIPLFASLRRSSRVDSCCIPTRRKASVRRQEVVVLPVVEKEEDVLFIIMPIVRKYRCRNRSTAEASERFVDAVDDDEDREVEEEEEDDDPIDPLDEDRMNFNGARRGPRLLLTLFLCLIPFGSGLFRW